MKTMITAFLIAALSSCSPTVKPAELGIGQVFPQVKGSSLTKKVVLLPDDYKGKETIILIGYKQSAQFDIDRWILGILQAEIPVQIVEVPTIAGMMPQMIEGFINNGMRSGIPKEDWGSVVTVYEDADKIVNAFGNERPQSAHVAVLGKEGEILWTDNRGYSASQVLEIKKLLLKKRE
jgi:hypothetical protein